MSSGLLLKGRPVNSRPDTTCLCTRPPLSCCRVRARIALSILVPPTGFWSTSSGGTWGHSRRCQLGCQGSALQPGVGQAGFPGWRAPPGDRARSPLRPARVQWQLCSGSCPTLDPGCTCAQSTGTDALCSSHFQCKHLGLRGKADHMHFPGLCQCPCQGPMAFFLALGTPDPPGLAAWAPKPLCPAGGGCPLWPWAVVSYLVWLGVFLPEPGDLRLGQRLLLLVRSPGVPLHGLAGNGLHQQCWLGGSLGDVLQGPPGSPPELAPPTRAGPALGPVHPRLTGAERPRTGTFSSVRSDT